MFNSYRFFVPDIGDIFKLMILFWAGWLVSVGLLMGLSSIIDSIMDYQIPIMTIAVIISYGAPMLYARLVSRRNQAKGLGQRIEMIVDDAEFHMSNTFASIMVCVVSCLFSAVFAVWITTLLSTEITLGRIAILLSNTRISIWTQIVADLIITPLFFSWFVCAMIVRGLTFHGIKPILAYLLAFVAIFLVNLDYTNLVFLFATVGCVALIYNVTRSMKLSYVCTLLMYLVRFISRIDIFMN